MASWTDGPEYAPSERPDAFVAPDAAPLGPVDGTPRSAPEAPDDAPTYGAPPASVPLESVASPVGPTRDPREAFDVATTPLTQAPSAWTPTPPAVETATAPASAPPPGAWPQPTGSAWGSAHAATAPARPTASWGPEQPVALPPQPPRHFPPPTGPVQPQPPAVNSPWPQPGTPGWFTGPPAPPGPVAPTGVTFAQIAASATPGVLISLALGALLGFFAIPLLFVAHALAARTRHRRRLVMLLFRIVEAAVIMLGAFGMIENYGSLDLFGWWDQATGWAMLGNLTLLVAIPLIVSDALRRGEPGETW